jgi:hypothetical protein
VREVTIKSDSRLLSARGLGFNRRAISKGDQTSACSVGLYLLAKLIASVKRLLNIPHYLHFNLFDKSESCR